MARALGTGRCGKCCWSSLTSEMEMWGCWNAPLMGQTHRHQLLQNKGSGRTLFVVLTVPAILWPPGSWASPALCASTPLSSAHLAGRWAGRRSDRYNENLLVFQHTFLRIGPYHVASQLCLKSSRNMLTWSFSSQHHSLTLNNSCRLR